MIHVDGERSLKRLSQAKKALYKVDMLDQLSGALKYEGFDIKVWRSGDGELSGGRIKAPFGIFVLLSTGSGFKQFVCDSAQTAAGPVEPDDRHFYALSPLSTTGERTTMYGTGVPTTMSQVVGSGWKPAQPTALPLGSELVVIHAAWERSSGHVCDMSQVTHCYSDGENGDLPHVNSSWKITGDQFTNHPYKFIPTFVAPGYFERMEWKLGAPFVAYGAGDRTQVLFSYVGHYLPSDYYFDAAITVGDVFSSLLSAQAMAKATDGDNDQSLGFITYQYAAHYSRLGMNFRGVSLLYPDMRRCTASPGTCATYYANPERSEVPEVDMKYKPSLVFIDFDVGYSVVDQDTLRPLAIALLNGELAQYKPGGFASDLPVDDPDNLLAIYGLRPLFGYPAESTFTNGARDTSTFADGLGNVYSWLRCCDPAATQNAEGVASIGPRLGGFKFQVPEGFIRVPLAMPEDVLLDSTLRPKLTLMTADTFCCIADKANGEIAGLYVGSPFGEWDQVEIPDGVTMYSIRVVQPADSAAETGFIGVGKYTTDDDESVYCVYLRLANNDWVRLSPIPVESIDDAAATWDVCVFGDDPLVASMMSARQHPVAALAVRPELR